MSLRGKRDHTATAAMNFKNKKSFVRLFDGALILAGKDWKAQKQAAWERDQGLCQHKIGPTRICGSVAADPHHIVKRSKGGSDNLENLISLCRIHHEERHPEHQPMWTPKAKP